ncbi:hypothetical protein DWF00_12155 [Bosea caraganae]|uniref:DUF3551 domain-containing protein n=1 Tax=Bosea caraganae TaxID=2763117 RepID=A0A370LCW8_9HYPH|nr:hypothetical protein [Bosea caraganae]RDJ27676.1 hypothetical protein DWF00_12155 [Bosea caraganae]RDJ29689.1 hypothetical protein DWE98_03925 [Bosea caraganae]
MVSQAKNSPVLNRISGVRLGQLAFVLGAAWAASALAPAPAKAMDTDWRKVCTFANSPQNYGDANRERFCMQQNNCQALADAQGSMFTGAGCVMVRPSTPAAAPQTAPRSAHTTR